MLKKEIMKKIFVLLLVVLIAIGLTSCEQIGTCKCSTTDRIGQVWTSTYDRTESGCAEMERQKKSTDDEDEYSSCSWSSW